MPANGIISVSAAHCGHQARKAFRPRMTKKDSVSMLILVYFAITPASARNAFGSRFVVKLKRSWRRRR
jgi:hypothetical protein